MSSFVAVVVTEQTGIQWRVNVVTATAVQALRGKSGEYSRLLG